LIINSSDINPENFKYWSRFALGLVLISQGVPFIHAGAEFFRSKKGIDNTYNLSDSINRIDWTAMENNYESVGYLRDLISIRKQYPAFRMPKREDIENNLSFAFDGSNLMFKLNGQPANLMVILKNDFNLYHLHHDQAVLIFDGLKKTEISNPDMDLNHPGIYILKLNQ
jgi:pullulanase